METGIFDARLRQAIHLSNSATAKDHEGKFAEAFELYKSALDTWRVVCKFQNNGALREKLYKKMEQYVSRAESLKQYLQQSEHQRQLQHLKLLLCAHASESGKSSCTSTYTPFGALSYTDLHPVASGPSLIDGSGADTPPHQPRPSLTRNEVEGSELERIKDRLSQAVLKEKPTIRWSDIAGLEAAKEALQEAVILPSRFPNLFTGERRPWRGILLYGPPGTGKTFLAKAIAAEANATMLSVSSADLVSKWQGESEKLVRSLFEVAREKLPSIIFIDEVDSMCGARSDNDSESSRRMKTEFLIQMQGITFDSSQVLVLGATNVPWALDAAIRRRFERRIFIPLPDAATREQLLRLCVRNTKHSLSDSDFQILANETSGFSGSDLSVLVRDALFEPIRTCRTATHFKQTISYGKVLYTPCTPNDQHPTARAMGLMSVPSDQLSPPDVTRDDFFAVLRNARPSISAEDVNKHVEWTKQFGVEGC